MQFKNRFACHAKKALSLLVAISLCALITLFPTPARADASAPDVSAKAAILICADNGEVVFEKNADTRLPMASTTKIMTALVAIENADIDGTVEIPPEAVGTEGSSVYLHEGELLTLRELLYAMLLESANDAAAAIAIHVAGSIEKFADMMNGKAAELSLFDTSFENPHGLDGKAHYTTARDLARLTAHALDNSVFRSIVSTYKTTIPLNGSEGTRSLVNHNKLLKNYEGCIGVKTGYTKKSGRCLVSAAERDGISFIAVTLNAPNDWADHAKLLDLGFSLYHSVTLCEAGEFRYVQPVVGGVDSCCVLTNSDRITVTLRKSEDLPVLTVELFRFSYAPISRGETVGYLVYTLDGETVATSPICATYGVERIIYNESFWDKITGFIGGD